VTDIIPQITQFARINWEYEASDPAKRVPRFVFQRLRNRRNLWIRIELSRDKTLESFPPENVICLSPKVPGLSSLAWVPRWFRNLLPKICLGFTRWEFAEL
jgi:hypothetical protein